MLDIPKAQEDPARRQKEREQLEKNIANSKRQLNDTSLPEQGARQGGGEPSAPNWPTTKRSSKIDAVMNPIVRLALEEDIGTGDVTSTACVPEARMASGRFLAREPLISPALGLLPEIYQHAAASTNSHILKHDGDALRRRRVVATVRGRARTLLECERVALNFLQRLSGVATAARAVRGRGDGHRAAACSIPARPRRDCARWKSRPRRRAA